MAVIGTINLVHIPFTKREGYAPPEPEGLAAGFLELTGDATGGTVQATVVSPGGFFFRPELIHIRIGSGVVHQGHIASNHAFLSNTSGLGAIAFDITLGLVNQTDVATAGFNSLSPHPSDLTMLQRTLLGRETGPEDTLLRMIVSLNTNLVLYSYQILYTYWRSTALYAPGFMASFWETGFSGLGIR